MKRTIARALRRLFRRDRWTPFDRNGELRPELFTREGWHMAGALTDEQRRDAARKRYTAAGRDAGELFAKSWHSKILDGIASPTPTMPNAAVLVRVHKVSWWRRLLRRFGR